MLKRELKNLSLVQILVIVLLIILLLQRCGGERIDQDKIKIIRDTTWVVQKNTINSKPQFIKSEPYPVPIDRWSTEYLPDTNYANLLKQYEGLVKELLSTNYFKDSLRIDSLGYVIIKDTVRKNMLIGSSFSYDLKYPIVKETRILPAIKKTQWFAGGFVQGEKGNLIDEIGAGLLIKNKRDQIFGAYAGLNTSGNLQIGISSYWKIKIKK